jgi:hypothetical protein
LLENALGEALGEASTASATQTPELLNS